MLDTQMAEAALNKPRSTDFSIAALMGRAAEQGKDDTVHFLLFIISIANTHVAQAGNEQVRYELHTWPVGGECFKLRSLGGRWL